MVRRIVAKTSLNRKDWIKFGFCEPRGMFMQRTSLGASSSDGDIDLGGADLERLGL